MHAVALLLFSSKKVTKGCEMIDSLRVDVCRDVEVVAQPSQLLNKEICLLEHGKKVIEVDARPCESISSISAEVALLQQRIELERSVLRELVNEQ
jgi:hypothetical protein